MTAVDARPAAVSLPSQLRSAAVLTWRELPRVIGASLVWLASLAPLAVAVFSSAAWWLTALSALPGALVASGFARFCARIARGDRALLGDILRADAVLAVLIVAVGTGAERLIALGGGIQLLGFLAAAIALVVAPVALAYGGVRDRSGLGAARGGVILAIVSPGVSISILALSCIAAFAVVGSLGALGVVVPAIVGTFAATAIGHLLTDLDARAEGTS